ncbi:hypothetical protein LXA43DRAFT_1061134 [Ganoderma leucocontextum]|nr:hypothetical protein LXA43DRAFT_1061134 [Ganoderma leucocontextum]
MSGIFLVLFALKEMLPVGGWKLLTYGISISISISISHRYQYRARFPASSQYAPNCQVSENVELQTPMISNISHMLHNKHGVHPQERENIPLPTSTGIAKYPNCTLHCRVPTLLQCHPRITGMMWGVINDQPACKSARLTQSFVHSHDGTLAISPRETDLIRLYIQRGPDSDVVDLAAGRADNSRTIASPERLLEQGRRMLKPYWMKMKDGTCVVDDWSSVVGQRVAEKYSIDERAFIAGDACRTHSPKAGQGLNASMGNTHNLGIRKPVIALRALRATEGH